MLLGDELRAAVQSAYEASREEQAAEDPPEDADLRHALPDLG